MKLIVHAEEILFGHLRTAGDELTIVETSTKKAKFASTEAQCVCLCSYLSEHRRKEKRDHLLFQTLCG